MCIDGYFYIVKSLKAMNKDKISDVLPGINMGISKSGNDLHEKKHNHKENHTYRISLNNVLP